MSGITRGGNYVVQATKPDIMRLKSNYFEQMRQAREQMRREWDRYLEEGWTQIGSNMLRSPDGKTEVHFD